MTTLASIAGARVDHQRRPVLLARGRLLWRHRQIIACRASTE